MGAQLNQTVAAFAKMVDECGRGTIEGHESQIIDAIVKGACLLCRNRMLEVDDGGAVDADGA